jgi:hypothetical protein
MAISWRSNDKKCGLDVLDSTSDVHLGFVSLKLSFIIVDRLWAVLGNTIGLMTRTKGRTKLTSQQSSMHSSIVPKNAG